MSEADKQHPFENLGKQLKTLREKRQETLADVSGAVEIEPDTLQAIEQGTDRPGEDILLLLISYFAAKEDIATTLWELAGYDQNELPVKNVTNVAASKQDTVLAGTGTPIVYTDMVHVLVNNYGVVMEFLQNDLDARNPKAVARVGMSREHAQSVIDLLSQSLSKSNPKQINPSQTDTSKNRKQT